METAKQYKNGDMVEIDEHIMRKTHETTGEIEDFKVFKNMNTGLVRPKYLIRFRNLSRIWVSPINIVGLAKLDREFKDGDLITGIDRSYVRSIYKVISENPTGVIAMLVSFDGYIPDGKDSEGKPLKNEFFLEHGEYRIATKEEIVASTIKMPKLQRAQHSPSCDCGSKNPPWTQAHAGWCKVFRQEF